MSKCFYLKMALSNIRKNKRMYFPYILTSIITIMMYYMMSGLRNNSNVESMRGGAPVTVLLQLGVGVTGIFAAIFLFYTNSFLMKRRKKEMGVLNILGMEKRHIARMLFYETLIVAVTSIILGLGFGILFSRLIFLMLMRLIAADSIPAFQAPVKAAADTILLFGAVFMATLIYNLTKIHLTKPIELLHGGEIGEKEPKTKILLTIAGVLCIGAGYSFALTTKSPLGAVNLFFIAVMFVIAGTYALFTAGSIALIKLLKRNKKFYYKASHFVSLSGMLYRMKQNAAGLANICVLSTMVVISVSASVSLYAGMKDTIKENYPRDIAVSAALLHTDDKDTVENEVKKLTALNGIETKNWQSELTLGLSGKVSQGMKFDLSQGGTVNSLVDSTIAALTVIPLEDYNRLSGTNEQLSGNEVIVYHKNEITDTILTLSNGTEEKKYQIQKSVTHSNIKGVKSAESISGFYLIVVRDVQELESLMMFISEKDAYSHLEYGIAFDTNLSEAQSIELAAEINALELPDMRILANSRYDAADSLRQLYGGVLFIGIFVGILFLMATVLIIYYKQISEGFDDRQRFVIMQKVGMSQTEVKHAIHSQVLLVFFLPLLAAAVHVAVSFRIMKMMLSMLSLGNASLYGVCMMLTFLIFGVIYGVVYMMTARTYYRIVSTVSES